MGGFSDQKRCAKLTMFSH